MAEERVDKGWQSKGLSGYSTAAILGTLKHYGVVLDEAGFQKLAKEKYPLAITEDWLAVWKGTGQFSPYPQAAADELWRRLETERLSPGTLAEAVAKLMSALGDLVRGSPEAPVGERFKAVDELRAKVPQAEGKSDAKFLGEVVLHLGNWVEELNHLAENLAKAGHVDDAADFAEVEEFLFPERLGTVKAMVRWMKGEKAEGVADLVAVASDGQRELQNRLSAVDALLQCEAFAEAKPHAVALLDQAEKQDDIHVALHVGERVAYIVDRMGPAADRRALLDRLEALDAKHVEQHPGHKRRARGHGHHHHHHH